jgi:3-oxoacyl-[acyl-carrier protein] reductase
MKLENRVALITGGGKNIGRAIALEFAREGADIIINGHRNRDLLLEVARDIESLGRRALTVVVDISQPDQVQAMVTEAYEKFRRIDISVANAAIRPRQSLEEISPEDWRWVIDTNLSSAFYLARLVLPGMRERRWGRLIHISGIDGFKGLANRAHNVTAKAGIHGFTKAVALEYASYGITVNTISPGAINTERPKKWYPNWSAEERAQKIPVNRIGEPWEIAKACVFLASDDASFITGQAIHINGGEGMF